MTRYHATSEGDVPFTEAEELERDAEESAHLAAQPAIEKAKANVPIIAELALTDLKSIRAMREYIAAQTDAPAILKEYEAQAITDRAKIIKEL